jgi:hypothetical protein
MPFELVNIGRIAGSGLWRRPRVRRRSGRRRTRTGSEPMRTSDRSRMVVSLPQGSLFPVSMRWRWRSAHRGIPRIGLRRTRSRSPVHRGIEGCLTSRLPVVARSPPQPESVVVPDGAARAMWLDVFRS